ncbi:MAG: TatD family hydrolase [bacterium]|nr:TatD family hydrolase [bacterium]
MLRLTDTHAHLCDPSFDADRGEVLERAVEAGIGAVVAVGETAAEGRRNLELSASDARIRPAAGLFPTLLDRDEAQAIEELLRQHRDRFVAVGEVGLDFWKIREEEDRELQCRLFQRFIDLAVTLDLPLNVHSRSTGRQVIELLVERGARRVQMHAFDGRAATARPAVDAGFLFSIPPSIARSPQKRKLVRRLPLESLLIETDSPVLGPTPGERNEPANAMIALREIAAIKAIAVDQAAAAIAENTRRLYGDEISP